MADKIKKITIEYSDHVVHMDIPDNMNAIESSLSEVRKKMSDEYGEYILSRGITVIIVAPKDIDISKIIDGIDDIVNPIKVSISDCKGGVSFDDMYRKWLSKHNK